MSESARGLRPGARWLLVVLLAFVLPGLALVGALAWLGNSEEGTRFIAARAVQWVPGLSLEVAGGTLSAGVQLDRLGWEGEGLTVEVGGLSVRWDATCLLAGRICVTHLDVASLRVNSLSASTGGPVDLAQVSTPWPIRVSRAQLRELQVASNGETLLSLEKIEARKFNWRDASISADALALVHLERAYTLRGNISLRGNYPLNLELGFTLDEPLPVPVQAQLGGTLRALTFRGGPREQLPLQLRGSANLLADGFPFQSTFRSTTEFAWPLAELPLRIRSLSGTLSGDTAHLSLSMRSALQSPALVDSPEFELSGTVDLAAPAYPFDATVYSAAPFDVLLGESVYRFQRLAGSFGGNVENIALSLTGAILTPALAGEQAFELAGYARPGEQVIALQQFRARLNDLPVEMSGEVQWSAREGLLARRVKLQQDASNVTLDGALQGRGLSWAFSVPELRTWFAEAAGAVSGQGVARRANSRLDVSAALRAQNIYYGEQHLPRAELDCRWQGEIPDETAQILCGNLRFELPPMAGLPAQAWEAAQPLTLDLNRAEAVYTLAPACLLNREDSALEICSTTPLEYAGGEVAPVTITGRELPLGWLELLFRDQSVLSGRWNFDMAWPGDAGSAMQWQLSAAGIGELNGSLLVEEGRWRGSLASAGVELAPLLPLVPELRKLDGRVQGDVAFEQDERGLKLFGLAALDDGLLGVFEVDSLVEEVSLSLRLEGRFASIEGILAVEDESLTVSGEADWRQQPWSARLRLLSQDIELEPVAGMSATVTADLSLHATPETALLRGEIFVPKARLDPEQLSAAPDVVSLSPDAEIVGAKSNGFSGPQLDLAVALRLGEDVQFKGYGLSGRLRGGVDLEKSGQRALRANGTILLADGQFRAYGQDLIVEEGRLEFTGSPYDPSIRVRAYRRHTRDDARVGITASGPLRQPRLQLYSSVAMSEEERMHYLLTGRMIDEASEPLDAAAVSQAAVAMGLSSTNEKLGKFAEQFGIQNFELGTEQGEQGQQAQVSGYFGPNLYVKYTHTPFQQAPIFSARYRLTEQFYLEGYQGAQSALELLWYIRRRQDDEIYPAPAVAEEGDAPVEDGEAGE